MSDGTQGLSAHDAAMVAKVDALSAATAAAAAAAPIGASTAPPTPDPKPRPEGVPEKFWDPQAGTIRTDELLKSYAELEKARGQKPQEGTQEPPQGAPATDPPPTPGKLNFAALAAELAEKGSLSEASIKSLEAVGLGADVAEQWVAGEAAKAELRDLKGFEAAGGKEAYKAMITWAATALSPAEQAAYDKAVMTGDEATMMMAITAMKARYAGSVGSDPTLAGRGAPAGGSPAGDTPFASKAEMVKAMQDPRYAKDPAYRSQVERRVGLMQF